LYTVQWAAFICPIYTLYSHWEGAGMNNVHACIPDPDPDPPDPHVWVLLDPETEPLVRGMDPDPDPSISKQN
jgi:hypothetical protein